MVEGRNSLHSGSEFEGRKKRAGSQGSDGLRESTDYIPEKIKQRDLIRVETFLSKQRVVGKDDPITKYANYQSYKQIKSGQSLPRLNSTAGCKRSKVSSGVMTNQRISSSLTGKRKSAEGSIASGCGSVEGKLNLNFIEQHRES